MTDSLRAKLPPIYGHLLPQFFDVPAVEETRATCDDCAMCDRGTGELVSVRYFKPDLKCCTYHPHLANYLVGAVFADGEEEGKRRLRAKIEKRIGITPYYVAAPRKYNVLYAAGQDSSFFGRSPAMLCPYFDKENGGRCTVWRYRESICSTFFCKYDRGAKGLSFWSALKDYLQVAEFLLAREASRRVAPELEEPRTGRTELTLEDYEDRAPDDYDAIWGAWAGREEAFYLACHEAIRGLDKNAYKALVDMVPEAKKKLDLVMKKYADLTSDELPPRLFRNPAMREMFVEDKVAVTPYNRMDSFALDKDLYDVLGLLSPDESLDANLARLAKDGIELAQELLVALYVQGVLVEPKDGAKPAK